MAQSARSRSEISYEALKDVSRPFEVKSGQMGQTHKIGRYAPVDTVRGWAIFLMILSHTVMALLAKSQIPEWGMVPIHLVTKFSSSLFFIVFGFGLRLFFLHHCGTPRWREKRNALMGKGLEIFVWYKILTFVQLYGTRTPREVFDHLIFRDFPDFVEVLSFYSLALLWVPLVLPAWRYLPHLFKPLLVVGFFIAGNWMNLHLDFGGWDAIKTLLVEFDGRYTFGQFQRGAFVFFGMILGDILVHLRDRKRSDRAFGFVLLGFSALFLTIFAWISRGPEGFAFMEAFERISNNIGKHPPNYEFVSFSVGGALAIFAVVHMLSRWIRPVARWIFWPWSTIGRRSLLVFNFHILFIFIVLRNTFELRHQLSYSQVLMCVGLVFGLSILLVKFMDWFDSRTEWEES